MKLYACSHCKNPLYFENDTCLTCKHAVGFDAATLSMITLEKVKAGELADIRNRKKLYRWCENAAHGTCNWLVILEQPSNFCLACELNRTIPELSNNENLSRWKRMEVAKHRLVYSLLRLRLPVLPKEGPDEPGITFDFMADISPEKKVMTGHDNGVITLNIEEADEAKRVRNKQDLGEKYRTLLGHFRHEIGHYYWDTLIKDSPLITRYRNTFGDERKNYQEALKIYYSSGAPADWSDHFISPYASAHPWEDWAETWAHYMHLMDTLETAYAFGVGIHPGKVDDLDADIRSDPYSLKDFDRIIGMWLPLTFAVNSLNRSMGYADFYPFVISPDIIKKLRFIHETAGAASIPISS
jgi:hypothetical protein